MYSLNAPLSPAADALVADLQGDLPAGVRPRHRPTLVVKRLGGGDHRRVAARSRAALSDAPACAARVDGLGTFDGPTGPILHLVVESPGLCLLHDRLCAAFDPVAGIEGADYVPHVTLGRGGDPGAVAQFRDRDVPPVAWTVDELWLWDADRRERIGSLPLGR
ncbi:2'-5' RNA ligase family protein [Halomarina halobia]|uniref:2'-5' RNA ligase family protein n=1 Tax=Halomarina halobia TaxID=3033386 RepID=A0ABD6A8X1_9EURY|nr:2'-5' RNA ligase family protein [Halomarina sp. PSR21]